MTSKSMKEFLRNDVPLLSDLSDDDIELLARAAVERKFEEGRYIVHKDDAGESAFILKQGIAETILDKTAGASIHLSTNGPGELFGELSLFDGEPRSASVIAKQNTTVIEIKRELFLKEIARKPETSLKLLSAVAKRLRHSNWIVSNFAERIYGDVMPRLESTVSAQLESAKVICRESKERVDMTAAHAEQLLNRTTAQAERVLGDIKEKWSSLKLVGAVIGGIFAVVISLAGFFGFESFKDIHAAVEEKKEEIESINAEARKAVAQKKGEIDKINKEAATLVNEIKKERDYLEVVKETRLAFENMRRDLKLDRASAGNTGDLEDMAQQSRDFFLAMDKLFDYLGAPNRRNTEILMEALDLIAETIDRNYVQMTESDWDKIIDAIVLCVKDPPDHWRQRQRLDYLVMHLHGKMGNGYSEGAQILVERLEALLRDNKDLTGDAAERIALILAKLNSGDKQVKPELEALQASDSPWTRSRAAVALVSLGETAGWEVLRKGLAAGFLHNASADEKSRSRLETSAFAAALMIAEQAASPSTLRERQRRFSVDELNDQLSAERLSKYVDPWPADSGLGLVSETLYEKITQDPGSWKNRFSWQYTCELICSLDCGSEQSGADRNWCSACYDDVPRQFREIVGMSDKPARRCSVAGG
jgi:CRP-like cAMP-binding protein